MQSLAFFQLGLHRFSFYQFSVNNDIIFCRFKLSFSAFKPRILYVRLCRKSRISYCEITEKFWAKYGDISSRSFLNPTQTYTI